MGSHRVDGVEGSLRGVAPELTGLPQPLDTAGEGGE